MKKSILFALCAIFAFALVACNPVVIAPENPTTSGTPTPTPTPVPEPEVTPEPEPEVISFTETAYTVSGNYVLFGDFPKTIIADGVTVDENESVVQGDFTYFKGSDGAWYVKQTENAYGSGNEYKYTDGTQAGQGGTTEKYFKVEPIKWRVLTTDYNGTGKKLLLAEDILIAHRYAASSNNYANSEIRTYLNDSFFNAAFTATLKSSIATTTVDNSVRSTNPDANATEFNSGNNQYVCGNTEDKVFLLSEQEVTKESYGFAAYNAYGVGNARIRKPTDYAKATGAYQIDTSGYGGCWWLRSPSYRYSSDARYVYSDGGASSSIVGYNGYHGVVPALCVSN